MMTPVLFGVLMATAGIVVAFVAFGLLAYFHEDTTECEVCDIEGPLPAHWADNDDFEHDAVQLAADQSVTVGTASITVTADVEGFRAKLMAELDAFGPDAGETADVK